MKHHILVVDDDEMIQAMVSFLAKENPNVRTTQVGSGMEMHAVLKSDSVDLLVLDLGLPDEDGLALARQVRARSNIPIIVLTGDHTKESLIAALEIGVNDFVRKPFDPYELQLRIKNQLRHFKPDARKQVQKSLQFGPYTIDTAARTLRSEPGTDIHLTPTEFSILSALAQRPDIAFSRNQMLDIISRGDEAPSDRAVDVYIAQLRQKIEDNPRRPQFIKAVRGFGYKLVK
ncbi:MAG: response regulator transcription factor [Rhodospirillales bacterium]|jgi:DNA-binding response OmpR family regulator|nr:response regulator transcription factor [Rhodospirillales bacterium]MBT4038970.1 response regulator transcription factor [Rhodospirillales bacterium]MBT4626642.1 response regulator transcription factor [Rhodospirillales bacterium]MBT5351886.1 response regulator transcription factor [Rhodospirillales bacterium]MBT5520626.1 response regulator transcription factor [Rhodospirillales bacterium]